MRGVNGLTREKGVGAMQPTRPARASADGPIAFPVGAIPPSGPAWIIVDHRLPDLAAVARRALAHVTRLTVVPDRRRRERRQSRLCGFLPERRTGQDRRRPPPSTWTQLGMVVVVAAEVGPPMEP